MSSTIVLRLVCLEYRAQVGRLSTTGVSAADSGHGTLRREEVDLAEVVFDVAERLAPLAQQRGLPLTIGPLAELLVWGNREELVRMLIHFVENALHYAAGIGTQIRIDAGCRRHDDVAGVARAHTTA